MVACVTTWIAKIQHVGDYSIQSVQSIDMAVGITNEMHKLNALKISAFKVFNP
jgi:hypothetical protein